MQKKTQSCTESRQIKFSESAINKLTYSDTPEVYNFGGAPDTCKNVSLRVSKSKKVFQLRYQLNKKSSRIDLGEYSPGVFGLLELQEKMIDIIKNCKKKYKWIKDPGHHLGFKEYNKEYTLRNVIEKIHEDNFPRRGLTGKLSCNTQRMYSRFLIGYNKRIDHLEFYDDNKGWGVISFKESSSIKTWSDLFKKYKPGKDKKKSRTDEISLYDHALSGEPITNITATQIEDYIDKKGRSFGQKDQIKDCLSALWNYARKNKMLGKNPTDPTKGIILTQDEEPRSTSSIWNEFKYKMGQLQKLYQALLELIKKIPFPALACLMCMVTGLRKATVCKLTYDMITEDDNGQPILKIPRSILKGRSKAGQKEEIHDITPSIREVINLCIKERQKNYKYMHTKYLFPSKLINKDKLMNPGKYPGYAESYHCRVSERTLVDCWNECKRITGIKEGSIKSLRKTYSSLAVEISGGAHRGILLTKHKTQGVLEKHYNKSERAEVTELAHKLDSKLSNIINFKKTN